MPTPTKGRRLGGSASHQKLMLQNLSASLFEHGRITTTETKAKRMQPVAESMITLAKKGDLNSRRKVASMISDKTTVHELFTDIAETMADREGGYTRITKIGNRKGDNAPMAVIELVTETVNPKPSAKKKAAKEDSAADSKEAKASEKDANADVEAADDSTDNAYAETDEAVDALVAEDAKEQGADAVAADDALASKAEKKIQKDSDNEESAEDEIKDAVASADENTLDEEEQVGVEATITEKEDDK